MSEQQREHVSALADGELGTLLLDPTISALDTNKDLRAAWERYSLIGSALRGEPVSPDYRQIAARVAEQLLSEPTPITAARPARHKPRLKASGILQSRRGHYAGMALAASAAFLAVYALPPLFTSSEPAPSSPALALATAPVLPPVGTSLAPSAMAQVVGLSPSRAPEGSQRWHLASPALESKLDQFLVNHQASSSLNGLKGIFPYATVVGYEAGR